MLRVACWGFNGAGVLGNGDNNNRSTPVSVGLAGVTSIGASNYHTCATTGGGAVYCWGYDSNGQVGSGEIGSTSNWPLAVPGGSGATSVVTGGYHTCAVKGDGSVSCWGAAAGGRLGSGLDEESAPPTAVHGLVDATSVSSGGSLTCAVRVDGTISCWGHNNAGQVGDGTNWNRLEPTPVVLKR